MLEFVSSEGINLSTVCVNQWSEPTEHRTEHNSSKCKIVSVALESWSSWQWESEALTCVCNDISVWLNTPRQEEEDRPDRHKGGKNVIKLYYRWWRRKPASRKNSEMKSRNFLRYFWNEKSRLKSEERRKLKEFKSVLLINGMGECVKKMRCLCLGSLSRSFFFFSDEWMRRTSVENVYLFM